MGHTRHIPTTPRAGETTVEEPNSHYVEIALDNHTGPSQPIKPQAYSFQFTYDRTFNITEFVELGAIIIAWYTTSSLTNNLNKSILNDAIFPFPLTVTFAQFGFIALFCFMMFTLWPQKFKLQKVGLSFVTIVLPLCISQVFAHLLTQMSLQHVPVSFTHTVKGCSPIFAILLSRYYKFNEHYTWTLFTAVMAIITGVVLSSFNEINFNFFGFITALGSTLIFSWQNAYSKKVFRDKALDHVNLLFYTAAVAFTLLLPVWLLYDLPKVLVYFSSGESTSETSGLNVAILFLLDGICHFGQNITAFTFMTRVTPLTYTVFNTFKRTFVILSAIFYFGNSVGFMNATGIALTTVGVALYNKAKLDMRGKE